MAPTATAVRARTLNFQETQGLSPEQRERTHVIGRWGSCWGAGKGKVCQARLGKTVGDQGQMQRHPVWGDSDPRLVSLPFNSPFPSSSNLLEQLNCLVCSLPLLECKLHKACIFCLFSSHMHLQLLEQQVSQKHLLNEQVDSITCSRLKWEKKTMSFCLIIESLILLWKQTEEQQNTISSSGWIWNARLFGDDGYNFL